MASSPPTVASTKPYLIRAIYEWCVDQGFVPYLVAMVDARTRVPREFVKNGQIVLNLGPDATHQLQIGNDLVTFSARFNGVAQALSIPIDNVAAIYARENGQGMAFEVSSSDVGEEAPVEIDASSSGAAEGDADDVDQSVKPASPPAGGGRPTLTRIK